MKLLSIDDFIFSDKSISPALITDRSSNLAFGVDRRAGLYSSVYFGSSAQAASWHTIIQTPDEATRDALMAVLAAPGEDQVRLLAQRDDAGADLVTIDAAVDNVQPHGSADNVEVTFSSNDSVWEGLTVSTVSKTFTSSLDQILRLPAPGNVPTQPVVRLTPTVQRAAPTAAVGWRWRRRIAVINGSDEPWFRYPVRLPLGDTSALVTASKALSSGADLRVWLHGLEQSRTLVGWNTTASYCWVIVPALPPGEAITYEIVYGNANATLSDGVDLVYPELPAFDLSVSSNYLQVYRTARSLANAAKGLWRLSSAYEGGSADYGVPGAWSPALTWENPNNDDSYVQPRAQRLSDGSSEWYQPLLFASRWRGPGFTDIEAYQGSDPYDGVVLYNPMGIRAVKSAGIRWRNDASLKTTVTTTVGNVSETSEVLVAHDPYTRVVIIGRDTGGESWHVLTEYGQPQGGGATSRLYLPSSGAALINPAFSTDWDDTVAAGRVAAVATKSATAMTNQAAVFTNYAPAVSGHFTYSTTIGSLGSGNTNFNDPGQIAVDASGNLYIADFGNNRLKKHDNTGAYVSAIASLTEIRGVCLDASGNIYVSFKNATNDYRVRKYDSAFSVVWTSNTVATTPVYRLSTGGGPVWAVTADKMVPLSTTTGFISTAVGSTGSGDGQFSTPVDILEPSTSVAASQWVYVVDQGNNRVQRFSDAYPFAFVSKWGSAGSGSGQFSSPSGIAVHPITSHVYIADTGNSRIQVFTVDGTYLTSWSPGAGTSAGQLSSPTGLAFSPDGTKLYISETGSDRITVVTIAWNFSGLDLLYRQYVYPLDVGVQFSTADTVKGQIRALATTGINARTQIIVRVMTADGTVRATLLGADAAAMANAFATALTNRKVPRSSPVNLAVNYTTVAGDYLVIEVGARFGTHTGFQPGATLRFGDAATDDLAVNESATTDDAPWIEFSTDLWVTTGDIHTEVATWRPPTPMKHFGIAVWPKGGVSIPDDAESRVLVESDGDTAVYIAAEPLVITQIEAETEIYELATEMRLHGGGNAVAPYNALLVGNARSLAGPGTPRAAVKLGTQGVQIDTEDHTHALWDTTFATQAEILSAHTVRAMEGALREIDAADIPALLRIPQTVPNATFASDLTGWTSHQTVGGWSATVTQDPAMGGAAAGSMRFTLTTTSPAGTMLYRSTTNIPVQSTDSVEVTAWLRQTDSGATAPRIGVAWYDNTPTLLQTDLNAAEDVPINPATDQTLTFAATPPTGATQFRVVVGVTSYANAPGSKWFDDVQASIIRPLRYDGSVAKVTEEARSSRWLPIAPARRVVPNGAFASDISSWALESAGAGITQTTSWDGTLGGIANGSLKIAITANTNSNDVIYRTTGFFPVNGAERVEMSAWVRTSHVNVHPRLAILWYGDTGTTALATSLESDWSPAANTGYVRSFAAIVPPGMTRFRLALVADTAVSAATGNAFFDDIKLNDVDLFVADVAVGSLTVAALVRPWWTA